MLKRIFAVGFILIVTSVAWAILAATIWTRTYESNDRLKPGIASSWGAPQVQRAPGASYQEVKEETVDGKKKDVVSTFTLAPASSRINVALNLDYRQKGLLWYSTYVVDFVGQYTFQTPATTAKTITYVVPFPAEQAFYDSFVVEVDGSPLPFESVQQAARVTTSPRPNEITTVRVTYRSHGLDSWSYRPADSVVQSRDFLLTMNTDFKDIDFPPDTLSPTAKRETPPGWALTWKYDNLISSFQIGMTLPQKAQPGPLAGDISRFAPVSLLLFFFVMFVLTALRNVDLHPMNYFFLAAAFFSFHLLLAYLVDHISIHLAFAICSLVSIFLVVSYLRLAVGMRFALFEAGMAQFIYLVLFSYTFFLKGFTGLAVTIGCIISLFVVMQMTGRIRWSDRFAPVSRQPAGNGQHAS